MANINNTTESPLPIYIRLPRGNEKCRFTGLSRGHLQRLILPCEANNNSPPVESISLLRPGKNKGVRLVVLKSLLKLISNSNQQ